MINLVTNNIQLFDNETYTIISKEDAYRKLQDCQIIQLDTETNGFNPHSNILLTQQFGTNLDQIVVDNKTIDPTFFKSILTDQDRLFLLQNAKFDLKFFYKQGIKIKNIYDTFLAECILTTGLEVRELGLDALALKYCNIVLDKSIRAKIHIEGLTDRVIKYAADDVKYLENIRQKQLEKIKEYNLTNVLDLENEVVKVFAKMEYDGISLNTDKWSEIAKKTTDLALKSQEKLDLIVQSEPKLQKYVPKYTQGNLFGFEERLLNINWSSPKQKLEIIRSLGFKTDTTGERFLQTNKKSHELIKQLIEHNKFEKLSSSFGKDFLKFVDKNTNRIHCNIWQILSTGRISVSDPNLNQIPSKGELGKEIRSCFIPKKDYKIVGGDFSGMELRIIAEFSQDPLWVSSFVNGEDLHSVLCAATFDIPITDVKKPFPGKPDITYRDIQKTINFGLAYGMSKFKLADTMQISVDEADRIIQKFFKVVPSVERFLTSLGKLAKTRGYIKTAAPYRRIRWFEGWDNKDDFKRLGEIERAGKNTPIQGTNGDIIKVALISVQNYIDFHNLPINILLSVYDEIQTECPEELAEEWKNTLNVLMIEAAKTVIKTIPIVVDCKISNYWEK
jgi:DNA polymerase-1